MRGFRCVPVALKYSPVMAGLTSFERDVVYSGLVAQDDRHCLPYDAVTLRSEIFPTRVFVAIKEIANARDRLVALGVFIRKSSPRKEWLEIAPEYRHTEGRVETSFGDEWEGTNQGELALGPVLCSREGASREGTGFPRARKNNGSRAEQDKRRTGTDSRDGRVVGMVPVGGELGSRLLEQGGESGRRWDPRFSRDASEFPADAGWAQLCGVVGEEEMRAWGAEWARRWRGNRDAVVTGLRDWQGKTPAQRAERGGNAAAFITEAFMNATRRAS